MRFLKYFLFGVLFSGAAFGQGAASAGNPVVVNGVGQPMAGVTVAICTTNPGASPTSLCSGANLATLYTDITITIPCTGTLTALNNQNSAAVGSGCSNPGLTDGQGNVVAFSAAGTYWCEYTGSNIVDISVAVCPFPGNSGSGASLVGDNISVQVVAGVISATNPFNVGAINGSGPANFSTTTTPNYLLDGDPFGLCPYQGNSSLQQLQFCTNGNALFLNFGNGGANQQTFTIRPPQGLTSPGAVPCFYTPNNDFEVGPCGGVQNQVLGATSIGASANGLMSSADAIRVSAWCNNGVLGALSSATCLNYVDESTAIQAIVSAIGAKGTFHIVDDMCGIQTWSVQPFAGASTNFMFGIFEFRSNCPASNPHIISVDGTSTILIPNGLQIIGEGTAEGSLTPQYGGTGNTVQGTFIRACNPVIYPCVNGGFVIQSGAITSTSSLSSNLSLVTMTAKPFTFSGSAFNNLQQYRLIHIVGSGTITNNAAWVVSDCNTTGCNSNPQTFHVTAPTGWAACASNCGTAYLDTTLMAIGTGGGSGVFGSQIRNLTLDCSFMPGCGDWVNAIGQELTGVRDVNAWNATVYGGRIDQSAAYNGASFASSNSGPYGPLSSNFEAVTCGLAGGCGCMGASVGCSSASKGTSGTVPLGTAMSVGAGTALATISLTTSGTAIDPAVNSNFHNFLFTGTLGQTGFGPMFHVTASMSDKSASGSCVPEMCQATTGSNVYGNGGIAGTTFGTGVGFYGIHGLVQDFHHEYALNGLQIGGDAARSGTFYYAYTNTTAPAANVITSGVMVVGGFAGATGSSIEVDVGSQTSDRAFVGDVEVRGLNMQNGGGAIDVQNNITGETCKSYSTAPGSDYVLSYFFGHSSNVAQTNAGATGLYIPQTINSCISLPHFVGNAFSIPLISTGAITSYGVPIKADASNAGQFVAAVHTDTGAGIVMGVSYHSTSAGGYGDVVTTGVVPMLFDTSGTGNCAIGNLVIIGTTTDKHVQCGAYVAGTVIGIALQAQSTTGGVFNVLVGLR